MDKILPKDQGKHDILIVVLIAAPLMVAGFVWAMISGGYTEPDEPSNVISIPAPSPAVSPAFLVTPES
jgi:nitrogen fixation-related uncharacterized protein